MESKWPTVRLGDMCEKIGSGATPRGGSEVYQANGIALIRSQNIYNDGFKWDGLAFVGEKHAQELENVTVQTGDILLNITGDSVARACQVPDNVLPARVNQHVAIIRPLQDSLDARYLRYYLVSPAMQQYMLALAAAGATRNALTKGMIEAFRIPAPLLSEQKAIAHILGTLDDKIALNRRMNETLEAMARAIFKSWFVDFDPVRAKAEGRQPSGMDAEAAVLFPDSFEDSPLGKIPKGWREGTVSALGEVICGKTPPTSDPLNYGSDMLFITIPDMHGKVFVTETSKRLSIKGVETQANKTLPPYSICVSCIATPGLVAITYEPSQTNQQINSIIPDNKDTAFYCYYVLHGLAEEIRARGSGGSVVTNLNKGQFSILPILIVPKKLMMAFHCTVKQLLEKLLTNEKQSRTLATTRDALLPKLLSGEINVKNLEEII